MGTTHINLLFNLIKSMAVVGSFAYLLALETNLFSQLINRRAKVKTKIFLIIFFGLLSLSGTYLGVYIHDAYANIRAIGAIVGGLIGGPVVGLFAGLIGGLHRYFLGGFTAVSCALSTTLVGVVGGIVYYYRPFNKINLLESFLLGVVVESLEMIVVLFLSKPYSHAYELVRIISLPMILSNALGITFFISILQNNLKKEEDLKALQAYKALKIANKTLKYLQDGLDYNSAQETARIILEIAEVAAVSITDRNKVLAHIGEGEDHHQAGESILTAATSQTLNQGQLNIVITKEEVGCPVKECELKSAVIAPLKKGEEIIGVLKLYKIEEDDITNVDIELARGIAQLLSTQLHISSLKKQAQLTTEAELKALQAQIHPHFLFNALNTIISFCRTDSERARNLLIKLSDLFRRTLKQNSKIVTLEEDLKSTMNYIAIEKARFGSNLVVDIDVDERLLKYKVPSFTLQPILENAVKHGISPKVGIGKVKIKADDDNKSLIIKIIDNGVGIESDKLNEIFESGYGENSGIGLSNVNSRIKKIYGIQYGIEIDSQLDKGTEVIIRIPKEVN